MTEEPGQPDRGWVVGSDASACGVLLILSAFFLIGIIQIARLRGNGVAGLGLALITASAMIATPKLVTTLMPVDWFSRFLERHTELRRKAASHAFRLKLSYSQGLLIQGGLAMRQYTSYDELGWVLFGLGCVGLAATYAILIVFQAGYRTTRDFRNLPAGSDWCARVELDVERVLGKDGLWKLAGLLLVAGTLITALSL